MPEPTLTRDELAELRNAKLVHEALHSEESWRAFCFTLGKCWSELLAAAERDLGRREAAAGTTHSEECWRWHLDCAVRRAKELEAALAGERAARERWEIATQNAAVVIERTRDALSDLVELAQIDPDDLPERIRDELPACEREDGEEE